ncbi:MAG: hypothetical protein FD138_2770, partial [Planctomycetota bacterium]
MTQATLTNWDKAAILLRALTPEPNQAVLSQLTPAQAAQLRSIMANVAKRPDLAKVTQDVLREFQELRRHPGSSGTAPSEPPHFAANWVARQYGES